MGIELYTKEFTLKDGIWYSEKKTEIFYPDAANEGCYQLEEGSFWFRHRNDCIVELVKRYKPNGLFFDVGGGNGYVAKAIEEAGIETVLIEPGEKGCLNAKKRNLKNIICATIEDTGFKKESMPAIGMFDVLEHMKNDIAVLKTMYDLLVKDGLIFISVPAYKILWSKEDELAGHFNRYTISSLSATLKAAGFEVLFATYMFSVLPMPIFFFRTISNKLGLDNNPGIINKLTSHHKKNIPSINKIWAWELNRIRKNKTIPFGGSCLVVAKKIEKP